MSERSSLISRLTSSAKPRASYLRSKITVNLSAQIRALRIKQQITQTELASKAEMKQSRISAMERPGAVKFNIETLIRLAAAFRVGLIVKFVPYSEVLNWENAFSQDEFDVTVIGRDREFLNPSILAATAEYQPSTKSDKSINEIGQSTPARPFVERTVVATSPTHDAISLEAADQTNK